MLPIVVALALASVLVSEWFIIGLVVLAVYEMWDEWRTS
jgi:hypothetical protein